jgi:hypothetical protein
LKKTVEVVVLVCTVLINFMLVSFVMFEPGSRFPVITWKM